MLAWWHNYIYLAAAYIKREKLEKKESNELVLSQVHPLNNVATIVKYAFNILRVDRRRKMRIAIVLVCARRGRDLFYRGRFL